MELHPEKSIISEVDQGNCYTARTVQLLSNGIVDQCKSDVLKVKEELNELTTKQDILIEQLHKENIDISKLVHSTELKEMFDMVKEYQGKLINIKKDMKSLHDRSRNMKKRVGKLTEHKLNAINKKSQQLKKEEDLIAKPSAGGAKFV